MYIQRPYSIGYHGNSNSTNHRPIMFCLFYKRKKKTTINHIDFATVHNIYRNDSCNMCNDNNGFSTVKNSHTFSGILYSY